jgi:RNA polymerase sigma-70 factor (ECF subfamily)
LLSLHYLQGVGLEELARAWRVHRATVSRWLVAAREAFLGRTRDELVTRAGIDRLEVDSLVRALQSQLEVSLRRLLDGDAAQPLDPGQR